MKTNNIDILSVIEALQDNAVEIFEAQKTPKSFKDYILKTSSQYASVQLDLLHMTSLKQTKEVSISKKFFS